MRKQRKIYEDEINEERKRWNNKLMNEIQRLELLREKDKKMYEEHIAQLEERNKKSLFSNDDYYKKKFEEIKNEYNDKLKEDLDKRREELENDNNDILEKKKKELDKKYQEMKKDLLKDRDNQLNIIIQKLSEERATAAAATLEKYYGVKNKISVIGKGEKEPIASNATEAGRAQNRRVEIILTTAE